MVPSSELVDHPVMGDAEQIWQRSRAKEGPSCWLSPLSGAVAVGATLLARCLEDKRAAGSAPMSASMRGARDRSAKAHHGVKAILVRIPCRAALLRQAVPSTGRRRPDPGPVAFRGAPSRCHEIRLRPLRPDCRKFETITTLDGGVMGRMCGSGHQTGQPSACLPSAALDQPRARGSRVENIPTC